MDKYSSYKDSEVKSIGEIPFHWTKTNIRMLLGSGTIEIQDGNHGELHPTSNDYIDDGIPFVMSNNLKGGKVDFESCKKLNQLLSDKLRIGFSIKGDVLLTHKGTIGRVSMVGDNPYPYIMLTPQVTYYRCKKEDVLINNFLFYTFQSNFFQLDMDLRSSGGSTRKFIGIVDQRNLVVIIPSLSEQEEIVEFLDFKTKNIDTLIRLKERKIKLLKEKRISLVNYIVTKGLDPGVKMIESDEKWIGSYPNHWEHIHFGIICNLQQGLQIPFDKRFFNKVEDSFEYITTQSIHRSEQPRQYIKSPKKSVLCTKDDIIYGRTGNTGEVVTGVEGVFHNNFFRIDFDKNKLTKDYLVWFLNNLRFKEHILLLSGTTTIPDLNHSSFFSNRILIPSIHEQQQIVEYLDKQTEEMDTLIQLEQKKIDTLKEYRQSLISEVVTGKIRVCEEDNSLSLNSQTI